MLFLLVTISTVFIMGLLVWPFYVLALFTIYRLTGGKRSFRSWFRAMQF